MRRIRVLQVITGLIPGGAERLVLDMMTLFNPDQFDIRLVSIVDDLRALKVYGHQNIPVEVFDLKSGKKLSALRHMRHFIKSFAPDVIHAHMFHSLIAALATSRFVETPPSICFTSHLNAYPRGRALAVRALKCLRDADIIFAPDQHPDLNVKNTLVIPNGVSVANTPPQRKAWSSGGKIKLLAVGRLAEQKDPLGLLHSLAELNLPELHLDFVGAGPLESDARSLAASLGLLDRVRFLGVCSNVRQRMREADIFVMHSRYEGMPMALLEAGAEAMPVISTPVGAIPEVVGADRGWLSPIDRFPETLRKIVLNPALAIEFGLRLHSHVLNTHSIQAATRHHEALYLQLASGKTW